MRPTSADWQFGPRCPAMAGGVFVTGAHRATSRASRHADPRPAGKPEACAAKPRGTNHGDHVGTKIDTCPREALFLPEVREFMVNELYWSKILHRALRRDGSGDRHLACVCVCEQSVACETTDTTGKRNCFKGEITPVTLCLRTLAPTPTGVIELAAPQAGSGARVPARTPQLCVLAWSAGTGP